MAPNDITTQSVINKLLNYFCHEIGVVSQIMSAILDVLCTYFCLNPMVIHCKTYILMFLRELYALL